jgi:transcriptional regulator with XRE-family HTH domain
VKDFEKNRKIFIERLREFLGDQSVLAASKKLGIPQTTMNGWVLAKSMPSAEALIMLATQFKCSIDYLVGLEN